MVSCPDKLNGTSAEISLNTAVDLVLRPHRSKSWLDFRSGFIIDSIQHLDWHVVWIPKNKDADAC